MSPTDLKLHATVIRLLRGILNAYETWFEQKKADPTP